MTVFEADVYIAWDEVILKEKQSARGIRGDNGTNGTTYSR